MKTTLILIAATVSLSACTMMETAAVDTTRDSAKAVVGPIVSERVPGPTSIALTDCIIDNASADELLTLSLQGATPDSITLVSNILARPETVACATTALT